MWVSLRVNCNQQRRQLPCVFRYFVTQTKLNITTDNDDDELLAANANVLPFEALPTQGKFKFWRGFLPGGEFHGMSIFDYATEMNKRYGDIYLMPGLFGKKDTVLIYNTKDIETVLRTEGPTPLREMFDSFNFYRENREANIFAHTKGLITEEGEKWRELRLAVNPVLLQPRNLKVYVKPISNINDEFIARIKEIRDPKTHEVPADFESEVSRLIFESISLIAFNRKMGMLDKNHDNPEAFEMFRATREIFRLIFQLDMQPSIWKLVTTPAFRKMMNAMQLSSALTHKFVHEAQNLLEQKLKAGTIRADNFSMLEQLIAIDPKLAIVMAMDLMFAGVDLSATALLACLLCLAKYPETQRKLRMELLKALPTKETLIDEHVSNELPYLRAVIKETLRYYPNSVGPFRTLPKQTILANYNVPKGTRVILASNVTFKNEHYYPKPTEFIPERWIRTPKGSKNGTEINEIKPFSYIPFGFGPRMCIGKRIFDMELEVSVAKIIRNFHVEFNYDSSRPFKSYFTMEPAIPFKFKFNDV